MTRSRSLLDKLKQLSPVTFERIICDLLLIQGLQNATWRTPGADGGRDIEGTFGQSDLSGAVTTQTWHIECKRYEESLDWPAMSNKLSHATNHLAHYLLICTTASLSPSCKDEVARHNERKHIPYIRYWDGADLEARISGEPALLIKYGMATAAGQEAAAILPLIALASKTVQAADGLMQPTDRNRKELELTTSLVELAAEGIAREGAQLIRHFKAEQDLYDWVRISTPAVLEQFPSTGLRAAFAAARPRRRCA